MSESLLGLQLEEYKLETKLGEGGMASVYRALDVRLKRYVAVKVIRASFRSESDYTMRFEREAQAIAQLEHPNIVTIYRYGELDNILYMAMQYVDGSDLADVIESYNEDNEFIDYKEIVRLTHEIGAALDYAHSKGVIHRDVKPHNILIAQDGRAIVSDFGLALLTEVGTYGEIFGSPHYIAPEQAISSAGVVPQSDLYSLGVILYEMLTSTVPFLGGEPLDIAMKHMTDEPPAPRSLRPELSQEVENVLLKALAKDPNDRYPTGKALATALENAMNDKPPSQPKRPSQFTITQRVELERKANPLPPIPAQMMGATPPERQPQTEPLPPTGAEAKPATQVHTSPPTKVANPLQSTIVATRNRTMEVEQSQSSGGLPILPIVIVGIVLLLIIVGLVFMLVQNGDDDNEAAIPTATNIVEQVVPTDIPNDVPAPTNAPTASGWTLEVSWARGDSFFITNQATSSSAFPLSELEIVGNGGISGSAWGQDMSIPPGSCVAIFESQSDDLDYANTDCTLIDETDVILTDDTRFWLNGSFNVIYKGNRIPCTDANTVETETSAGTITTCIVAIP